MIPGKTHWVQDFRSRNRSSLWVQEGSFGLGLMEGKQKLFYLPEPHTDFIFSVIGEERGLLGTISYFAAVRGLPLEGIAVVVAGAGPVRPLSWAWG